VGKKKIPGELKEVDEKPFENPKKVLHMEPRQDSAKWAAYEFPEKLNPLIL